MRLICLFSSLAFLISARFYAEERPPSFLNQSYQPNRWSVIFTGQYLLQNAESEGLDIAYSFNESAINSNLYSTDGQIIRGDLPWKSSARIIAGFAYDQWDLIGSWTFYRGNGSKEGENQVFDITAADGPVARFVDPVWLNFINENSNSFFSFSTFSSSFYLHYDCADLSFGKSIYFNKHFFMRPSFGLRAARIDQNLKFSGIDNVNPSAPLPFFIDETVRNRFRGIGMRAGFESRFAINRYFSFYSEGIVALLFGGQKGGVFAISNTGADPAENIFFDSQSHMYHFAILPNWQLDVGLKLSYPFENTPALLEVGVGYELTYWPHQWFVSRMYPELNEFRQPGDVAFRALVIEGTFAY